MQRNLATLAGILLSILSTSNSGYSQESRNTSIGDGIFKASWPNFRQNQQSARIVLALANGPSSEIRTAAGDSRFVVKASVLHEFRKSLLQGSMINILLPKTGAHTTAFHVSFRGDRGWTAGLIFLMPLWATEQQGEFETAGNTSLIGVNTPYDVDREDIPLIEMAMDKLGEISKREDLMLTRDEAINLLDSNALSNYYIWALGATGLAVNSDKAASDVLYNKWFPDKGPLLSPRQIVWLDHCFADVMSEGVGPDRARRHDMLIDYLKRLSEAIPTMMPSKTALP